MSDTSDFHMTVAELQAVSNRNPFNAWLGVQVLSVDAGSVVLRVGGRAEFIGTAILQRVHGGILGSLIDVACGYTVMARTGFGVSTVSLHTDFHHAASLGELQVVGRIVHRGNRLNCAEAHISDAMGQLLASGRGHFYNTHTVLPEVADRLVNPTKGFEPR
ncbi:PaaI family thioesterase [Pseudomonas sp. GB2N2]